MFRFNLQPLLNHRKYLEEKEQVELAEKKRQFARQQTILANLKQAEQNMTRELRARQKDAVSTGQLSLYSDYLAKLEKDIAHHSTVVEAVRGEVAQKRDDLLTAVKNRKSLSKLKASKLEAYNQQVRREEQMFLDEVGVNMFVRKKSRS